MNPRKIVPLLALALATCGAGSSGRHDADVLVALGAGVAGTWETEFDFANPDSDNAVNVFVGEQPFPYVCIAAPCGIAYAPLPRTGSARIVTRTAEFGSFTGRLFVGADDAEELPTVTARVVNRARPSQDDRAAALPSLDARRAEPARPVVSGRRAHANCAHQSVHLGDRPFVGGRGSRRGLRVLGRAAGPGDPRHPAG